MKEEAKKEDVKQQEPLYEFGVRYEEASPYVVEKSFYLSIRFGPPVPIPKGETVWVSKQTAEELFFSCKVAPLQLGEFFRVTRPFLDVQDGQWVNLKINDVLRLTREEAITLLRKQLIIETQEVEPDEMQSTEKFLAQGRKDGKDADSAQRGRANP